MYFLLVSIVVEGVSSTGLVLPHSSEQIILKDFTFWSSSTIHNSCHCNQEVLITGRCTSPPYLIVVVRVDSGGGICLICSDKEIIVYILQKCKMWILESLPVITNEPQRA